MSCFKKRNSLLHSSSVKESRSNLSYFQYGMSRFFEVFTSDNNRSSSSSIKFRSFAIKSASLASPKVAIFQLQAALLRHVLRKVCLQLGRERHDSRARPSPRATSSRRPPSSVLLRKVLIDIMHMFLLNKKLYWYAGSG